jgi:hypothetical protein
MEKEKMPNSYALRKQAIEYMIQTIAAKPQMVSTPGTTEKAAQELVKGAEQISKFLTGQDTD